VKFALRILIPLSQNPLKISNHPNPIDSTETPYTKPQIDEQYTRFVETIFPTIATLTLLYQAVPYLKLVWFISWFLKFSVMNTISKNLFELSKLARNARHSNEREALAQELIAGRMEKCGMYFVAGLALQEIGLKPIFGVAFRALNGLVGFAA
jgi:hypothetical protein